jgi:dihydrofolate reductase
MSGCEALLMGRRTYEVFAPVWPTRLGDPAIDHINWMAEYVVSSTLTAPEWNNTSVISGDPLRSEAAPLSRTSSSTAPVPPRTLSYETSGALTQAA